MFATTTAQMRVARKIALTIMETIMDPLSVLTNTNPTMAASVVAPNPIHAGRAAA